MIPNTDVTNLKLPSAWQVNEEVDVNFGNSHYLKACRIAAVKFTDCGKVLYDVRVPYEFDDKTIVIENVDSLCICKVPDPLTVDR